MPKYIKVFGIQRTCTTFMRELCKRNLNDVIVYTNEFGSKHQAPRKLDGFKGWVVQKAMGDEKKYKDIMRIVKDMRKGNYLNSIIVIKNPYSWYQSAKRWYRDKFIFEKLYKRYNRLYTVYRDFHLDKSGFDNLYGDSCVVRYEDVLKNVDKVMAHVSKSLNIEVAHRPVVLPNQVPQSKRFSKTKKKFYLGNGRFGLDQSTINTINNILDWDLMEFYGYKRIIK